MRGWQALVTFRQNFKLGGYTKYTNFKAVDTKSVAFLFHEERERNDGEVRRVKTETHG